MFIMFQLLFSILVIVLEIQNDNFSEKFGKISIKILFNINKYLPAFKENTLRINNVQQQFRKQNDKIHNYMPIRIYFQQTAKYIIKFSPLRVAKQIEME